MRSSATPSGASSRERRELTAFAERWFLRTRSILRRVIPLRRRDLFEAELFRGLSLDGDMLALTRSLRTYFDRLATLPTHPTPGTRTLATMLHARGLTEDLIAAIRIRLDALDALAEGTAPPDPPSKQPVTATCAPSCVHGLAPVQVGR